MPVAEPGTSDLVKSEAFAFRLSNGKYRWRDGCVHPGIASDWFCEYDIDCYFVLVIYAGRAMASARLPKCWISKMEYSLSSSTSQEETSQRLHVQWQNGQH